MRTVAERQGKDPQVAAAMVRPEIAIEGVVEGGKLLTLTTVAAQRIGFTDGVFNTRAELLTHLNLAGSAVITVTQSPAESFARLLTDPYVATVLITIALAAMVIEVLTAGFGFAGIISILAFSLYFGGHIVAGLAGREVIFLFVIGIMLLLVEIVIPGFGIVGLSGLGSIIAAIVLSAETTQAGFQILVWSLILTVIVVMISFRYLKRSSAWSQIILTFSETKERGYVGPTDFSALVGKEGITLTTLRPSGAMEIEGKRIM